MNFFNNIRKYLIFTIILILAIAENNPLYAQLNPEQQELIRQYTQQIKEYKAKNQLKEASNYLNKCAFVYVGAGKYEEAIESYQESTEINNRIGNDKDNKKIYNNIAMLYAELGQMENSLKYFEKSLLISRRNNNKNEIAVSLMDVSTILMYNHQYNKAIEYLEEALKIANDQDNFNSLISCYDLLAKCYKESGNKKKADEYSQKYLVLDQMRKEGKTNLKNASKDFLNAESNDAIIARQNQSLKNNTSELTKESLGEGLKKEVYISKDSLSIALQNHQKAEIAKNNLSKTENKPEGTKPEMVNQINGNNRIYIYTTFIAVSILVIIAAAGIYLLRKKQKYIRQLEEKISAFKKEKAISKNNH